MHLYWRIIEELKYIGEMWTINDPSISRYYDRWLKKHSESIRQEYKQNKNSNPVIKYKGITHSLN